MTKSWRLVCGAVLGVVLVVGAVPGTAGATGLAQGSVASEAPSARTPHVLDNQVRDLDQVGERIVAAGTFTQVRDAGANGGTTFAQRSVFAFDDATGAVHRGFRPTVNGTVNAVLPGAGSTVYIGGTFSSVNGTTIRNLAQLDVDTGRLTAFRPPAINGAVNDIARTGNRLVIAGVFDTVGGTRHGGLATLDVTTGALDPYLGVDVVGHHNWDGTSNTARGSVGVENIDLAPDGSRLVAIGNFTSADGLPRDQAAMIRMNAGGAAVDPTWRTEVYEFPCFASRFDHYMRDVEFAPDGSFFAIATSGGANPGTWCDTVARFDTAATGDAVMPRWTAYSGGDSTFALAISDVAVYAGGHSRWLNNPSGRDSAGPGSVPRPSLAALDVRTGVPLDWNPGRHPRGVGVLALHLTEDGVYLGSDTEFMGNREYRRPRLAYLPIGGGYELPPEATTSLPASVVMGGRAAATPTAGTGAVVTRFYDGSTVGPDTTGPASDLQWAQVRGAFVVDGTLYYGYPNAAAGGGYYLHARSFDGTAWGPARVLNPYSDPEWDTVPTGSIWGTAYYRGAPVNFYGQQLSTVTGMFFADGRLYYTRSGSAALHWRGFSTDSGIVEATERTAAPSGFGSVAGMFLSGGQLYWADSGTGALRRTSFSGGVPGAGSTVAAPGPAAGGTDWRTRAMFLGAGGPAADPAPVASFAVDCAGLVCSFDAGASTDPGGTITSYAWTWGDGTADGEGVAPTHIYPSDGTYSVTLTVTDDAGGTGTAAHPVPVTGSPTDPADIAFVGAGGTSVRGTTPATVTVPDAVGAGDALVLVMSVNSGTVGMTTPPGWTLEDSQVSGNVSTRVFSRVATAADAGDVVTVPRSRSSKATLQVAAYSGTADGDPVDVTGDVRSAGTAHTTPTATADPGSWVLSVWSDKQAGARTWTAPPGTTVRSNLPGVGSGDVASLLADGGGPAGGGQVGGLTATVGTASNQATVFTVVLAPGAGGTTPPPVNEPPVAAFDYSCSALACTFDAGSSTDDGTVTGWAWDFGDGGSSTERRPEHVFAAAGEYQVTLRVTDDQGSTGELTSTVPVTEATSADGVGLRGSAGTAARVVTSVSVEVPDSVEAGDGLLLVLSTNSAVSGAAPAGYALEGQQRAGNSPTTQVFSRVAGPGDAGTTLTVSLTGRAKVTLQLLAYWGTAASGPVGSLTGAETGSGTAHTTPTTSAPAGSWVVSVWSDKQADARQWTPPARATERSNVAGIGNGDIATLVADSGGPVAGGTVGGLTATVPTPSNRATLFTVVLATA